MQRACGRSQLNLESIRLGGGTRVLAIIGDPVVQAKVPPALTRLLQSDGHDAVMVPLHVRAPEVPALIELLAAIDNFAGLVVTVPHKQLVATLVDDRTRAAEEAQAVNVVRRTAHGWQGDLMDGTGFVAGLRANGFEPRGRTVAIAGAGGAGHAIAFALATAAAAHIAVHDADAHRRDALVERLRARAYPAGTWALDSGADLLVNATPCGMRADDPLPIPAHLLRAGGTVAEVLMEPERTRLLDIAQQQGAAIVEGRHMLEQQLQAMRAFFGETLRTMDGA